MVSLYASVDRIRAEANQLDPVKVLLTLLIAPFWVLGWTVRLVWVVPALMWTGAVQGWRAADAQIKAREAAARGG